MQTSLKKEEMAIIWGKIKQKNVFFSLQPNAGRGSFLLEMENIMKESNFLFNVSNPGMKLQSVPMLIEG